MNIAARPTPDETRDRILSAAEEMFRRVGYWKTTVGDIAEALGMSSANIYRFFPSKKAINEALCARLLGELLQGAEEIAAAPTSARERIFTLLMTLHRHHREQMTNQDRVHEMVVVAMEEDWASIEVFLEACERLLGQLVAEGQAAGEFGPGDPMLLGELTLDLCAGILHPTLIAKCAHDNVDDHAQTIVAFAMRALLLREPFEPIGQGSLKS
jgi:AcrR family transcriptional regulator